MRDVCRIWLTNQNWQTTTLTAGNCLLFAFWYKPFYSEKCTLSENNWQVISLYIIHLWCKMVKVTVYLQGCFASKRYIPEKKRVCVFIFSCKEKSRHFLQLGFKKVYRMKNMLLNKNFPEKRNRTHLFVLQILKKLLYKF